MACLTELRSARSHRIKVSGTPGLSLLTLAINVSAALLFLPLKKICAGLFFARREIVPEPSPAVPGEVSQSSRKWNWILTSCNEEDAT